MSDLSPQSGPKRTLMIQIAVTNRDFMSTRPNVGPDKRPGGPGSAQDAIFWPGGIPLTPDG
jgi:hypothetical protein